MAHRYSPQIGTQATAVVTGSFLSGAMMGISLMTIRVFLDTDTHPSQLLHQWIRLYHYGHQLMPSMAIATCLLYGYTTIRKRYSYKPWLIYVLAGTTTVSMLPFTWIIMSPTNNTLFRLDAESTGTTMAVENLNHVQQLVRRWGWLHFARSLFPLVGAIIGLTGTLQELMV